MSKREEVLKWSSWALSQCKCHQTHQLLVEYFSFKKTAFICEKLPEKCSSGSPGICQRFPHLWFSSLCLSRGAWRARGEGWLPEQSGGCPTCCSRGLGAVLGTLECFWETSTAGASRLVLGLAQGKGGRAVLPCSTWGRFPHGQHQKNRTPLCLRWT